MRTVDTANKDLVARLITINAKLSDIETRVSFSRIQFAVIVAAAALGGTLGQSIMSLFDAG